MNPAEGNFCGVPFFGPVIPVHGACGDAKKNQEVQAGQQQRPGGTWEAHLRPPSERFCLFNPTSKCLLPADVRAYKK
jgi:hypothetical protein